MASLRERLVGHRYQVGQGLVADVRKSCRDELKILYEGGPFDDGVWERLRSLAPLEVFEASKLNPAMKDLVRLSARGVRLEGARGGALVVAFFKRPRPVGLRRRVEALLRGDPVRPSAGARQPTLQRTGLP
jgi:hypothetical protein